MMVTECSMSNISRGQSPQVNFVRPCNLCPHMKQITLPKVLEAMVLNRTEIIVAPEIADKARAAVGQLIELSK